MAHDCACHTGGGAVQNLDELQFEKGIWGAAHCGDLDRIKTLAATGKSHQINSIDGAGYTSLHYAARNGHLDVCKYLINNGAAINATTRSGNATALHRACSTGREDVVRYLLEKKADVSVEDSDGKNALHRAAEAQHVSICALLDAADASLKTRPDHRGNKPVDYAKSAHLKNLLS